MPHRTRTRHRFARALSLALVLPSSVLPPAAAVAQSAAEGVEDAAGMAEPVRRDLAYTLPAGQAIAIDNPYGSVFLRFGGYAHELGLHTTQQQPAGAAALTLAPGAEGGRFVVAPRLAKGATLARGQRLDIVAYVPQHHAVSVRTGDGGIESRGVKSDLDLRSASGAIAVRGTDGTVQAETGEGSVEVALDGRARAGTRQRLATTTGNITVGVTDGLDARVRMATSGVFATDYSIDVVHRDGEEPNKTARAAIGAPGTGKDVAEVVLESRRGEVRLLRRAVYVEAEGAPPDTTTEGHEDKEGTKQ